MDNRSDYISKVQNAMHNNGRVPYSSEIISDVLDAIDLIDKHKGNERKREILKLAKERGEKKDLASVEIITCGERPGIISDKEVKSG